MLKRAILGIILNGAALYAAAYFLDGITYTGGVWLFVLGGAIMGLLNLVVKPILKVFSLPIVFLTAGAFLIVINAALFWVTVFFIETIALEGLTLTVDGLVNFVIGALLFGLVNWAEHLLVKNK